MTSLTANIDDNTFAKLKKIASDNGISMEECILLAAKEYVVNYEDNFVTDLNAVNLQERSFFFGAGE